MYKIPVPRAGGTGAVPRAPAEKARGSVFIFNLAGKRAGQFQRGGSLAGRGRAGKQHGGREQPSLKIFPQALRGILSQNIFKHDAEGLSAWRQVPPQEDSTRRLK